MSELLAFLGVSALVIVTPGQDTALTIRSTLVGGRRAGVRTVFERPRIRRVMDGLTGAVLVSLGVRLASEQR